MTLPELQFRIKAAVKGVLGTPEGQAMIREAARTGIIDPMFKAVFAGEREAFEEVCHSMDRPVGSARNPRW
jgi:hypothetical protein